MSSFVVAYDIDQQTDVLKKLRQVAGASVTGAPQADGTITIRTTTRSLDDETAVLRAIEDIPGVIDLRLL